ncbi:MAG: OadG family transporter subunit [Gammaproteobacteria bacterium]|jgi:oxaloacetate decarboxylase gamma subunit|nr:OadG family transporter subunit [Gammaproteobacteria bacterium]|tara:strand:+ start:1687 stop:1929 length:243 start_codon:yes stop_codon:yes gene_type:complete
MDNLFSQGVELAVFGMGTVFLFLALLILATRLMSLLVLRFQPETVPANGADTMTQQSGFDMQQKTLAIISAAIMTHRKNN